MKKLILVSCCFILVSTLGVLPAEASCILLPSLEESIASREVVFVGEVVDTSNDERTATVEVAEIWKGPVPEGSVEVVGGAEGANVASSVDRTYKVGVTYLFVPDQLAKDGRFRESACSPTRPYRDRFERFRPASARILAAGDEGNDDRGTTDQQDSSFPLIPVILGGAGLLVLIYLVGYLGGKHRSSS